MNCPNAIRVALKENDSVRISRLATLLVVAIRPVHSDPGAIDVSFMSSAMIRGGSLEAATTADGQRAGAIVTPCGSTGVPGTGSSQPASKRIAANNA
jgi:hypothetical protein